ncbi:MAG: YCF48-related protein [Phycisphaerales bacterium]|nr:YCF48-related protein [Phycisphaerales bacterium]
MKNLLPSLSLLILSLLSCKKIANNNNNNNNNSSLITGFAVNIKILTPIISTQDTGKFSLTITSTDISNNATYIYSIVSKDTVYDYVKNKVYYGPSNDTLATTANAPISNYQLGLITKMVNPARTVVVAIQNYINQATVTKNIEFAVALPFVVNVLTPIISTQDTGKFSLTITSAYTIDNAAYIYSIANNDTIYDYEKNRPYYGPSNDTLATTANAPISNYKLGLITKKINPARTIAIAIENYNNQFTANANIQFNVMPIILGFAVGSNGVILKTTTGGSNWLVIGSSTNNTLNSISFFSKQGIIAGNNATVIYTRDSGTTWTQNSNLPIASGGLLGASYYNTDTAFIVGQALPYPSASPILLRTNNGAQTWTQVSNSVLNWSLTFPRTITSIPSASTILTGGQYQTRTTNQFSSAVQGVGIVIDGVSYSARVLITSISFFANSGVAVGYYDNNNETAFYGTAIVRATTGRSWTPLSPPFTSQILKGVALSSATNGATVGTAGAIAYTTDGGDTWATANSPTTQELNSVAFYSATNGIAVGANGTILQTTDGGQSWTLIQSPTTETLNGVTFLSN